MAASREYPVVNRKLKEYRKKYGQDFLLEMAAPEDDEAAQLSAIQKQIDAGIPQKLPPTHEIPCY